MSAVGRILVASLAALVAAGCQSGFAVDGARAHARVVHQVEAGPRIPGTPGHEAVRGWIAGELERLGARVESQRFVDSTLGRPMELTNLIGRYGPASVRRIVLCAHWDTRPFSDRDPDPAHQSDPCPGANDGGSGVAVLLEIAELLHGRPPAIGVDLVFFDGEDQGREEREFLLGSREYARRLAAIPAGQRPVAAFLFDMVGDRELQIYPETQSAANASNLVAVVLDGAKATHGRHFHPTPRHTVIDDHVPLHQAGLPAIDIIDFDYPEWHTHLDLPDRVSPESLAEVSRVAAWIVYNSPLAQE